MEDNQGNGMPARRRLPAAGGGKKNRKTKKWLEKIAGEDTVTISDEAGASSAGA